MKDYKRKHIELYYIHKSLDTPVLIYQFDFVHLFYRMKSLF